MGVHSNCTIQDLVNEGDMVIMGVTSTGAETHGHVGIVTAES